MTKGIKCIKMKTILKLSRCRQNNDNQGSGCLINDPTYWTILWPTYRLSHTLFADNAAWAISWSSPLEWPLLERCRVPSGSNTMAIPIKTIRPIIQPDITAPFTVITMWVSQPWDRPKAQYEPMMFQASSGTDMAHLMYISFVSLRRGHMLVIVPCMLVPTTTEVITMLTTSSVSSPMR